MLVSRLPLITAICLCALISGVIYWQLFPYINAYLNGIDLYSNTTQTTQTTDSLNQQRSEDKQRDYNISSFKLFGDALAPTKVAIVETEKLPETTLKLRLTGVLAGKNNLQAGALIEGPDRQTRSYRIEEEVPGGAILKQVFPDRVVLERSGRLENLIFEETRSIGIETQVQAEREETADYTAEPSHSGQSSLESFNQQQTQQIKDRLSKLRSRLQSNSP
jgi:general secretion pathway protein C